MTSSARQVREPEIDTPVMTAEDELLGYVKEVRGGYFKINAPRAQDFWLSNLYIESNTMDHVTLSLNKYQVKEHRLAAPGAEFQEPDGIVSDADALAQRERMERELELQRARMRNG